MFNSIVPEPYLIISDPDSENENQKFRIRIRILELFFELVMVRKARKNFIVIKTRHKWV